ELGQLLAGMGLDVPTSLAPFPLAPPPRRQELWRPLAAWALPAAALLALVPLLDLWYGLPQDGVEIAPPPMALAQPSSDVAPLSTTASPAPAMGGAPTGTEGPNAALEGEAAQNWNGGLESFPATEALRAAIAADPDGAQADASSAIPYDPVHPVTAGPAPSPATPDPPETWQPPREPDAADERIGNERTRQAIEASTSEQPALPAATAASQSHGPPEPEPLAAEELEAAK
ncbi:MAG: hypothetical protein KDA61_22910, partial [Planctomycetales bacterium]|nr:hypothetical protein [Planctomycetales bacterium]